MKNTISDSSNECWYAIQTKSRNEKKVFERLVIKGFEAYLPLVTTIKLWSDRKKKVSTPLISSFVFVRTKKELLIRALETQGTAGVLKFLGKPAIIRDYEIENLKILMQDSSQVTPLENIHYEPGEHVEVINGAFAGLIAELVQIQGKHRIVVKIESLGSRFSINIPLSFIKKQKVLSSLA
jgi:transcription antitermination factor NusG